MSTAGTMADDDGTVGVADVPRIPGLRSRRYRGRVDHAAMAHVWNAQAAADSGPERLIVDTLDSEYQNLTNCDPATDILLAEVDGEVIALTLVEWLDHPAGGRRYDVIGALHPAWRRQRVGTAMLGLGLQRAREIGDAHEAAGATTGQDRWFWSWGADSNVANTALLRQHGFRPIRRQSLMVRGDLEGIDVPPLPPGIDVRDVRTAEHRAIFDASTHAFRDSYWVLSTS